MIALTGIRGRFRRRFAAIGVLVAPMILSLALVPPVGSESPTGQAAPHARAARSLPLSFEPSDASGNPEIRFVGRTPSADVYFTPGAIVFKAAARAPEPAGRRAAAQPSATRLVFVSPSSSVHVDGAAELPGKVNRFLGSDPSKWQTDLPIYAGVVYRGLYPGVDLTYDGADGSLKGSYLVAPRADPGRIRWRYEGATGLAVDAAGALKVEVGGATLTEQPPVAWQDVGGRRVPVAVSYDVASDGTVGFRVAPYDIGHALTIDPTITYSTYLGGSRADEGRAIALDSAGNTYLVGTVTSSDFPTVGAVQPAFGGSYDAVVTKLNPAGTQVLFSTYIGGAGEDDGRGVSVDAAGNVYVTGYTESRDFPVRNAFQASYGGGPYDAFVAKLSPSGAQLSYSTYLGGGIGGNGEEWGLGIVADSSGNAYAVGKTGSSNFPTRNAARSWAGGDDAYVAKFDPAGGLVFSTLLGGSSLDWGETIAVDAAGEIYVAGRTTSSDFPVQLAYQSAMRGELDAFVVKLSATGGIRYATYLGGSALDKGYQVVPDRSGNILVTGMTTSGDFPTTASAYQPRYAGAPVNCPNLDQAGDAFVVSLNPNVAGQSSLVSSTYFGGSECDSARAMALDAAGDVYISGWTQSTDLPVKSAIQGSLAGGEDVFVAKFDATLATLMWSTFIGGTGDDIGYALVVDAAGTLHITGATGSPNFPVSASPLFGYRGGGDGFLLRIAGTSSRTPGSSARVFLPLTFR